MAPRVVTDDCGMDAVGKFAAVAALDDVILDWAAERHTVANLLDRVEEAKHMSLKAAQRSIHPSTSWTGKLR